MEIGVSFFEKAGREIGGRLSIWQRAKGMGQRAKRDHWSLVMKAEA